MENVDLDEFESSFSSSGGDISWFSSPPPAEWEWLDNDTDQDANENDVTTQTPEMKPIPPVTDSPMSTFSSIQYFNGDMHLWASSKFNGNGKKVIYDTVM